jgi:hypothetical protein
LQNSAFFRENAKDRQAMTRFLAALCIAALLANATPASARHARLAPAPAPAPAPADELITAASNPCDLAPAFISLKETVDQLATKTLLIQDRALRLRHTQRSYPYKLIENDWKEIIALANPVLDKLSDFPIAIDASNDGPQKKAALALIRAYQKAIERFVDAAHYSVNNERSENMLSMNLRQNILAFGINPDWTKTGSNNIIRRRFESSLTEAHEATLSLPLPAQRFARVCRMASTPLAPSVQTVANACELKESLFAMRETIRRMGDESSEAGDVVTHLKATSRWHPYKHIEGAWSDVLISARSSKAALMEFTLELDPTPDTPQKTAAQDLIEADRNAVDRILGYMATTVGFERAENNISMNYQRQFLTFGVSKQAARTEGDNIAHQEFNKKFAEPENALYALKIPEYHYAKLCAPTT